MALNLSDFEFLPEPAAGEEPATVPDVSGLSLREAALAYAAAGIPVFPCGPDPFGMPEGSERASLAKRPAVKAWEKVATVDAGEIEAWWTKDPTYNIGLVLDRAGLCAVDVEKDGLAAWEALERAHGATGTQTNQSARGGKHFIFAGRLRNTTQHIAAKIDTRGGRGDGQGLGYILAPPSRVNGSAYVALDARPVAPVPSWIVEACKCPEPKEGAAAGGSLTATPQQLRDILATLDPGMNRDDWRAVAAGLHDIECTDRDFDKAALFDEWSSTGANYTGEEACQRIYDDMAPKGGDPSAIHAGTLLRMANAAGYTDSIGAGPAAALGEIVAEYVKQNPEANNPTGSARFPWREPDEDADLPDLEFWDDEHIWPRVPGGYISIAYGPTGSYKSVAILADAMEACLTRGARILFLAGEGSYGVRKNHVPALCRKHGITPKDLRGKWRTVTRGVNLTDPSDVEALIAEHLDFRPDWIVTDTLATAIGGLSDNDASTAALFTGNGPVGRLRDAFGALTIFVGHTGKDPAKGIRGTSGYPANVDHVLKFIGDRDTGAIDIFVEKMRDAQDRFHVYRRAIKDERGIPVARQITEAEFKALGGCGDARNRELVHEVARAVRQMELGGSANITTNILATTLLGPPAKGQSGEEWAALLSAKEQKLQRGVLLTKKSGEEKRRPGPLYHYVLHDADHDPVTPYRWKSPDLYDPGDEDD